MLVSEAIKLLQAAELKQLSVKTDKEAILGYINMGILEIHKRFVLWQEEAKISMIEGITKYTLNESDPNVGINLVDHVVLMIEELYGPSGDPITLNDENDPHGVWTPQPHIIEVLLPIVSGDTSVIYRASPKFLTNERQEIPLPFQFLEALFNYVGYRGHGSVKGDIKSENNTHYMRFEQSCNRLKLEGLIAADDLHSTKFVDRGFV